jgi:origin recognition complex subunit 1
MAFSGPAAKPHTSDNQSIAPTIHQSKLTQFDVASHALQLSTVPDCLPCRETEQMELRGVLAQAIHEGHAGGCIYISGVPGTGKTASVHAIIRQV